MTAIYHPHPKQLVRIVLGMGAAVGILLAVAGALVPNTKDFSGNVVARVNGKAITLPDVDFALGRLSGDGQQTVTSKERSAALRWLVDQELLIQRGVEIGLLDSDLTVRKAIAGATIDTVVASVLAQEPTEEELRAFYTSHTAVFTVPAQVHVQHISCGDNGDLHRARDQAEQASAAIAHGMSFPKARERYGDEDNVPLPDALLPLSVLRRLLGPTLGRLH
jgi:hypothetical protein